LLTGANFLFQIDWGDGDAGGITLGESGDSGGIDWGTSGGDSGGIDWGTSNSDSGGIDWEDGGDSGEIDWGDTGISVDDSSTPEITVEEAGKGMCCYIYQIVKCYQ